MEWDPSYEGLRKKTYVLHDLAKNLLKKLVKRGNRQKAVEKTVETAEAHK